MKIITNKYTYIILFILFIIVYSNFNQNENIIPDQKVNINEQINREIKLEKIPISESKNLKNLVYLVLLFCFS